MDFTGVLVQQVLRLDDTTAQQLDNEGARASERVRCHSEIDTM